MKRGDIYDADLEPTKGSEQAGRRPVVIVSNNTITGSSQIAVVVPCTSYKGRHLYPTHVFLQAGDGALPVDSVAVCEQVRVLSKSRLLKHRGTLAPYSMTKIGDALLILFDIA